MKFVVEDAQDQTLPEGSVHTARITEIKLNTINWVDRQTGEPKQRDLYDWWFEIIASRHGDEYVGRRVKGSTNAGATMRANDKMRSWIESLLDMELTPQMNLDTDDFVGLECSITIGHRVDKKDPSRVWEDVANVESHNGRNENDEPPF